MNYSDSRYFIYSKEWNLVARALTPATFVTFRLALPELENVIEASACRESLFAAVSNYNNLG